jgi:hypothetical protein
MATDLGPHLFVGDALQALLAATRLVLLAGLPISAVVPLLALLARRRDRMYPRWLRPWFRLLAALQVAGAAIVLLVDVAGLLTAPWQFRYLAGSWPLLLLFVVPVTVLTAPLWLVVFRRLEPDALPSIVPAG